MARRPWQKDDDKAFRAAQNDRTSYNEADKDVAELEKGAKASGNKDEIDGVAGHRRDAETQGRRDNDRER